MAFKRRLPLALLAGLQAPAALASSDKTCQPSWRPLIADRLSACNNLAFLSPGNDSRVDLQLLLDDARTLQLHRYADCLEDLRRRLPPRYRLSITRLQLPFRIGLIQNGQWQPPDNLQSHPWFRGDVVFLLNPSDTTAATHSR
jgi:hypothetical protein